MSSDTEKEMMCDLLTTIKIQNISKNFKDKQHSPKHVVDKLYTYSMVQSPS